MQSRTLGTGNAALEVSAIGLGCMGMTQSYGPPPGGRREMITLLRSAVDRGVTFFDTAQVYGPFANEALVGEALAAYRDQVAIATKFGYEFDRDGKQVGLNSRPEQVKATAEGSLTRLGVEKIDLYYQHRVDPSVPIEEVAGGAQGLNAGREGRKFGVSSAAAGTKPRAH